MHSVPAPHRQPRRFVFGGVLVAASENAQCSHSLLGGRWPGVPARGWHSHLLQWEAQSAWRVGARRHAKGQAPMVRARLCEAELAGGHLQGLRGDMLLCECSMAWVVSTSTLQSSSSRVTGGIALRCFAHHGVRPVNGNMFCVHVWVDFPGTIRAAMATAFAWRFVGCGFRCMASTVGMCYMLGAATAGSRERAAGSEQQAAGSWQQVANPRKSARGKQHTASSRQCAASCEAAAGSSRPNQQKQQQQQ